MRFLRVLKTRRRTLSTPLKRTKGPLPENVRPLQGPRMPGKYLKYNLCVTVLYWIKSLCPGPQNYQVSSIPKIRTQLSVILKSGFRALILILKIFLRYTVNSGARVIYVIFIKLYQVLNSEWFWSPLEFSKMLRIFETSQKCTLNILECIKLCYGELFESYFNEMFY